MAREVSENQEKISLLGVYVFLMRSTTVYAFNSELHCDWADTFKEVFC